MWKYTVLFGLLLVGSLGLAQAPPAEDEIASMQAAFGEVTVVQDVENLGSRLDDHESRITTLEQIDLGAVQRRLLALEEARQALQIKIDNNRAKVEGVEAALGGYQSDIESLKTSISDLGTSLEAQGAELTALKEEVASLKAVQDSQWAAIILAPVLVGTLVYFLLQP